MTSYFHINFILNVCFWYVNVSFISNYLLEVVCVLYVFLGPIGWWKRLWNDLEEMWRLQSKRELNLSLCWLVTTGSSRYKDSMCRVVLDDWVVTGSISYIPSHSSVPSHYRDWWCRLVPWYRVIPRRLSFSSFKQFLYFSHNFFYRHPIEVIQVVLDCVRKINRRSRTFMKGLSEDNVT